MYWVLAKDKTFGKSEDQLRRWRNPHLKAVRNFVDAIGDRAISEIDGEDMLDFRQWWIDRIEAEELTPNSANKDLVHLADILKTVNRMKRLGLVLPLSDLALKQGEKRQHPPFSNASIKDKLLHPGALAGLNRQARCILFGMEGRVRLHRVLYNQKRKHARNGMLSPAEFERQQKMRREGV